MSERSSHPTLRSQWPSGHPPTNPLPFLLYRVRMTQLVTDRNISESDPAAADPHCAVRRRPSRPTAAASRSRSRGKSAAGNSSG